MLQSYYPKTGYPGTRSDTRRVPGYKNTRKSEHYSLPLPKNLTTALGLSDLGFVPPYELHPQVNFWIKPC